MNPNAFRLNSLACWVALSLSGCSSERDARASAREEAADSGTRSTSVSQRDGSPPAESDSRAIPSDDRVKDGGIAKSCEDVVAEWSELIANAQGCHVDNDCRESPVDCDSGLGVCTVLVNPAFDAKKAAELVATVRERQCRSSPCECYSQTGVACVDGACRYKPRCGSHEVFDTWADSSGRECRCDPHRGTVCKLCGEHWQGDQWPDSSGCICACTNDGETVCSSSCNSFMNDADAG